MINRLDQSTFGNARLVQNVLYPRILLVRKPKLKIYPTSHYQPNKLTSF